jgi:hypothetical protein
VIHVVHIGLDDTDTLDSPGTNQLARAIANAVRSEWRCERIVRHQLLFDPRVPYTSKNGSASITLEPSGAADEVPDLDCLAETCRRVLRERFVPGSDPGLCVAADGSIPAAVTEFGLRCQREIVTQAEARSLAAASGLHLEGLGGTEGGVIGALAAVGLAVRADDGRIIQFGGWPDDLGGVQPAGLLRSRGVELRDADDLAPVEHGLIDLGRRLRPNLRGGRPVLFVRRDPAVPELCHAVKLP